MILIGRGDSEKAPGLLDTKTSEVSKQIFLCSTELEKRK